MYDVVIVGAGPVGLACAIEAKREGLTALVIDKGALVNSLVGYPARMEFFSTPELIEIGGYPFPVQGYKPTREDAIEYYRGVAAQEKLDVRLYERVPACGGRRLHRRRPTGRAPRAARRRLDRLLRSAEPPRRPGEDLPKVTHYYREPYRVRPPEGRGDRRAQLGRQGRARLLSPRRARSRSSSARRSVRQDQYWIKPDLENRIKEGSIKAYFNTR